MNDLISLLYQALSEPLGLIITTPDPPALRNILYRVRRKTGDFLLNDLEFRILPSNQLAIVNRATKEK